MRVFVYFLISLACISSLAGVVNRNPGFEAGLEGWELYKSPGIESLAKIELRNAGGDFDSKHIFMRLPAEATHNQSQYVRAGQLLNLSKDKRYRYSVDVQWTNPDNSLDSAIVSIWVKDQDNAFSGKDVWLKDGRRQRLEFEFSPNSDGWTDCYIMLLTHQDGFDVTEILFDNFRIEEVGASLVEEDPRQDENLILNGGFEDGWAHWEKWKKNPHQVDGLNRRLENVDGNTMLRLELPSAENNTFLNDTSIGLFQRVKLYAGNRYELSADIDRVLPTGTEYETIVNLFAHRLAGEGVEEAWLGSVDYKFNKSGKHRYSQPFTPSVTTEYLIFIRVFGWGNEGRPLKVNVDNIRLVKASME